MLAIDLSVLPPAELVTYCYCYNYFCYLAAANNISNACVWSLNKNLTLYNLLSIIDEDGPGIVRLKDMKTQKNYHPDYNLWFWIRKRIVDTWDDWLLARKILNISHQQTPAKRVFYLICLIQ